MPKVGSQVILCDLPVRFDTYEGCSHACRYCFVSRKADISDIKNGESTESLRRFIRGERRKETQAFDWNIPLHWGGMSDPFQPIEKKRGNSLEALKVFAESGYPFAVSTKNKMIAEGPYFDLITKCNAVVQFSACSARYDRIEQGASTFEERLRAAETLTPHVRVNIRIQPYIPGIFREVLALIPRLANIGVHGITLEAMKYNSARVEGLVGVGNDLCYPVKILAAQFEAIRNTCHKYGLRFYCGENRLRALSDDLCCCGVEGLGWKVNTANLNHILFDPSSVEYTPAMLVKGSADMFGCLHQTTIGKKEIDLRSYAEQMTIEARRPYPYMEGEPRFTDAQAAKIRHRLVEIFKASGKSRKEVDQHLGTNGMAGHYFGASQWAFPTPEAWDKLRQILPIGDRAAFLLALGIKRENKPLTIYGLKGTLPKR